MHIDDQIKQLLRVKSKIDLYKQLLQVVTEGNWGGAEADVLKEFRDEVAGHLKQRIDVLGNPQPKAAPPPSPPPVPAAEAPAGEPAKPAKPKQDPNSVDEHGEPRDPLRFLAKWRHLEGKEVRFQTANGEVTGKVRGMVAPKLVVVTDTGYTVNISPSEINKD